MKFFASAEKFLQDKRQQVASSFNFYPNEVKRVFNQSMANAFLKSVPYLEKSIFALGTVSTYLALHSKEDSAPTALLLAMLSVASGRVLTLVVEEAIAVTSHSEVQLRNARTDAVVHVREIAADVISLERAKAQGKLAGQQEAQKLTEQIQRAINEARTQIRQAQ